MYSQPTILCDSASGIPRWAENTGSELCRCETINPGLESLLPGLGGLAVIVVYVKTFEKWLETNNASLITHLSIRPALGDQDVSSWRHLFERLATEATNITHLSVHWDAKGPWARHDPASDEGTATRLLGLGRSVEFVRGLGLLRVKESVMISGFYAENWLEYLGDSIGVKPVDEDDMEGSVWARAKRDYQEGTGHLEPFDK